MLVIAVEHVHLHHLHALVPLTGLLPQSLAKITFPLTSTEEVQNPEQFKTGTPHHWRQGLPSHIRPRNLLIHCLRSTSCRGLRQASPYRTFLSHVLALVHWHVHLETLTANMSEGAALLRTLLLAVVESKANRPTVRCSPRATAAQRAHTTFA